MYDHVGVSMCVGVSVCVHMHLYVRNDCVSVCMYVCG